MDKYGHSTLVCNRGEAQWDPSADKDVEVEFGRRVVKEWMDKGYFLVDEDGSKLLRTARELRADSSVILMPPVVGG